jgi:predicted Zn-dependent protease
MYTEAIAELQKSIQLSGDSPIFNSNLAHAYFATNRKAEAVELLNDLKRARFLAIRSLRKLPWSTRPWATKTKP